MPEYNEYNDSNFWASLGLIYAPREDQSWGPELFPSIYAYWWYFSALQVSPVSDEQIWSRVREMYMKRNDRDNFTCAQLFMTHWCHKFDGVNLYTKVWQIL